eukprot:10562602-Karenia_brevis.AAC.1
MGYGDRIEYWIQSNYVARDRGGYISTENRSGIQWMILGSNKYSSVCAHVVQVGWGYSRDEILTCAEQFGE